jgi:hypothetical protein
MSLNSKLGDKLHRDYPTVQGSIQVSVGNYGPTPKDKEGTFLKSCTKIRLTSNCRMARCWRSWGQLSMALTRRHR